MNLPEEIKTIDDFNEVSNVINKSSFIAQVYPVLFENEVKEYLAKAKKKYYDASHHCYAFKLADGTIRYSDAGEPNGTAGLRILNAIEHFNLSNQLIIISRIFGGVKLGVGPLGKAYYESASKLINDSRIREKHLFQKAEISATFDQVSVIHRILTNHKSTVTDSKYGEGIKLFCLLKSGEIESISKKISELGKNTISIIIHSETVYK
jgi:uncharacterized YigZ family protein